MEYLKYLINTAGKYICFTIKTVIGEGNKSDWNMTETLQDFSRIKTWADPKPLQSKAFLVLFNFFLFSNKFLWAEKPGSLHEILVQTFGISSSKVTCFEVANHTECLGKKKKEIYDDDSNQTKLQNHRV